MNSSIGEAWEEVASDPDPHTDLNYEFQPLTVIELEEMGGGMYMVLPGKADHLQSEEFIIAEAGDLCHLDECR